MNIGEWIDFTEKKILTKSEAQELLEMSDSAFAQSVNTGRLKPVFERGKGRSKVRLFYRQEVEEYKKRVVERRKRLQ